MTKTFLESSCAGNLSKTDPMHAQIRELINDVFSFVHECISRILEKGRDLHGIFAGLPSIYIFRAVEVVQKIRTASPNGFPKISEMFATIYFWALLNSKMT